MLGYKVPDPGRGDADLRRQSQEQRPFRVVTGHGAFVMPVFRKVRFLTLAMCEAEVAEKCVTQQGITLNVRAVIAFKVGNDTESIISAAQRFLSDQDQMAVLTGRIFAGHLRSIIGSMTVEQIIRERQKLADRGARRLQGGDGPDRPHRRRPADPVHRRRRARLHHRDVGTAQRGHPAAGADRSGAGEPGGGGSRAGVAAQAGRIRPRDGRSSRRSTRPRSTRRRRRPPRPARWPKPRPSARCCRCGPNWPSAPPSCDSRNWSPRWSSRRRRKPNASGSWRWPTRRR